MAEHMFVRLGKKDMVQKAVKALKKFNPRIERDGENVTVYAPDGDIVFQAMPKNNGIFICRYHDQVFNRFQY